ncbi:MAG: type II toxin-antitoxin system RelE/ParE family toxin [Candidatus Colwellbacteria bacterium]
MQVEFWKSDKGRSPALDFIESLDDAVQEKIYDDLETTQQAEPGVLISSRLLEKVQGKASKHKLYETKTKYDGMEYRLTGRMSGGKLVVVDGFIKKDQKTPQRYIDRAIRRAIIVEEEERVEQKRKKDNTKQ